MKRTQFFALVFLLIAANAIAYFSSCRQDEAASLTPNPTGDMPASDRSCTDDTWCSYVIQATTNCSVELCGDLAVSTGFCNYGCASIGIDKSITVSLTANTPYAFCVKDNGSVHVLNPPTATQAITVTVTVAGTNGVTVNNLAIGQSVPFSSDGNCTVTNDFCF
jgi:hypothetical protein